jgi:hypothetical protein
MTKPTPAQIATAEHVEGEIMVMLNEWLRDGADVQDLIAALGKAAADVIIQAYGPGAVAPWFIGMAVNASKLPNGRS